MDFVYMFLFNGKVTEWPLTMKSQVLTQSDLCPLQLDKILRRWLNIVDPLLLNILHNFEIDMKPQ